MSYANTLTSVDLIIKLARVPQAIGTVSIKADPCSLGNTVVLEKLSAYSNVTGSDYIIQGSTVLFKTHVQDLTVIREFSTILYGPAVRALIKAKFLEYSPGKDLVVHGVHSNLAKVENSYYTKYLLNAKHPNIIKLPTTLNRNSGNYITATVYPAEMRAKLAARLRKSAITKLSKLQCEVIELAP